MLLFQKISLVILCTLSAAYIAAQKSTTTVAAILSCPVKSFLPTVHSQWGLSQEQFEAAITDLTHLILQGNKEALYQLIEEQCISGTQRLTDHEIESLRSSFSNAIHQYATSSCVTEHTTLLEYTPYESPSLPIEGKRIATQAVMKFIKEYAQGPSLLSSATAAYSGTSLLKAGAAHLITRNIPYTALLQRIAGAWSSARQEVTSKEQKDAYEEELIETYPLLHIAHTITVEKALKLIYLLYSPYAHPCERVQALFIANHIHLLGRANRMYRSCIAQLNYRCFSAQGTLLEYDPTRFILNEPRPVLKLITLLKKLCSSEKQYLTALQEGASYGIQAFKDEFHKQKERTWKQKKESTIATYSREFIKGVIGYNFSLKSIDPARICAAKTTKDFILLMKLCEKDAHGSVETTHEKLATARSLIAQYKTHTCKTAYAMQRYYTDRLGRSPHAVHNALYPQLAHETTCLSDASRKAVVV